MPMVVLAVLFLASSVIFMCFLSLFHPFLISIRWVVHHTWGFWCSRALWVILLFLVLNACLMGSYFPNACLVFQRPCHLNCFLSILWKQESSRATANYLNWDVSYKRAPEPSNHGGNENWWFSMSPLCEFEHVCNNNTSQVLGIWFNLDEMVLITWIKTQQWQGDELSK